MMVTSRTDNFGVYP